MDIRVLTYGYNEIKMLPLKKAWCDHHGLKMVYFDNESTDGSKEWAIKNGVYHNDIITDGGFDIVHIMNHVDKYRQENEYDWSILAGVDLFLSGTNELTIHDYIDNLVKTTYFIDGIECNYAMICRTDNKSTINFKEYSRYDIHQDNLILLADHSSMLSIDNIVCIRPNKDENLWWFNFGHTKSKEERLETYERRKLSWERGLHIGYGNHYRNLAMTDFTVPFDQTKDIHETTGSKPYRELCSLLEKLVY